MSDKKYIDKKYLLETLRDFDREILSKKYTNNGQGTSGQNGITPHIGNNGNWYIGDTDTGIVAEGKNGTDVIITENESNTKDYYRLNVKNGDNEFTSPNLVGVIGMEYKNKSVGTPVGEIISYMGTIVPENYLICDGTVYQIADYPFLAQHFADNFGSKNYFGGDGINTFAVPDLRGEFLRGSGTNGKWDYMINTYGTGVPIGQHQEATYIMNGYISSNSGSLYFGVDKEDVTGVNENGMRYPMNDDQIMGTKDMVPNRRKIYQIPASIRYDQYTTGCYSTFRPTNTSVLYCIKYQPTYWITPTNLNEDGAA